MAFGTSPALSGESLYAAARDNGAADPATAAVSASDAEEAAAAAGAAAAVVAAEEESTTVVLAVALGVATEARSPVESVSDSRTLSPLEVPVSESGVPSCRGYWPFKEAEKEGPPRLASDLVERVLVRSTPGSF